MRVLFVTYDPSIQGGVASVMTLLGGLFPDHRCHYSIKAFRRRWQYHLYAVAAYLSFLARLIRSRFELVHVVVASPADQVRNQPYILLSRLFGLPVLVHFHYGIIAECHERLPGPVRWLVGFGYRQAELLCFLSERLRARFLERVGPFPTEVIPNPIDSDYFDSPVVPLAERLHAVLFLGRLTPDKGLNELIEAARIHSAKDPNVVYDICGDGKYPRDHPACCRFHGWVTGSPKKSFLRNSKVLALPSHGEALPVCVAEALACGTPVVATMVGGIPDMVGEGEEGLLVDPGDVPTLAAAIAGLTSNDALWEGCSRNARHAALSYHPEAIRGRWVALYEQARSRRGVDARPKGSAG